MKCLFVVSDFNTGGITSSLKNLCNELISRGHEVYILNLPKVSKLPDGFHKGIHLIELDKRSRMWNFGMEDLKKYSNIKKFPMIIFAVFKKILNKVGKWHDFVFKNMPVMSEFDIAIGFRQGPVNYYIVKNKTLGAKKVGFWHGDPDYMGDTSSWDSCVYDMDLIAGVSNAVCEGMLCHYPMLKGKLRTVYNIFDCDSIREQADEYNPDYKEGVFNIVTVSRIELFLSKNNNRIPNICKKIKEDGKLFHWTVVGDGKDKEKLSQIITENNLEKEITLVGAKKNPYPYIKNADLFVLTSTSESYGMVVMESLILGTPVVAGDYPALKEILEDNFGIRAENSTDGIYCAIEKILNDDKLYKEMKNNCMNYNYSADKTYEQFLSLCGD